MSYAELHCKTNFSFLEGASHAHELVEQAAALGYSALAVTDRNTLAGVVRAHAAAKEAATEASNEAGKPASRDRPLRLIIGAEIVLQDAPPVVLWVPDRAAYGRLARLLTLGRRRAVKGACELTFADLADHAQGLLAGLVTAVPPCDQELPCDQVASERVDSTLATRTPSPTGPTLYRPLESPSRETLQQFRDLFGERGYLLAALHRGPDDRQQLVELQEVSRRSRIPLVASGNVLYHIPGRLPLHDVLTAVRLGTTVAELGAWRQANAERHLHALDELQCRFAGAEEALRRTEEIAARCTFSLDELRYEYPEELAPAGQTPFAYLQHLTWKGAARRYPGGVPDKVRQLLEHELALVEELRYEAYFLTVWDLVRFARRRNILCQGRGSAANSAICFCLGVTSVDPAQMDVLFERFVSRERQEAPDIDVDFEHERREEVLQYLYDKYGRERAGMTGVFITYRTRSAIRDVGKALGLSLDCVDALAKQVDGHAEDGQLAERCRQVGVDPDSDIGRRLVYLVEELRGFPRHLSQHVGGMVMTRGLLCELVPIENAAMIDRTVIEWDKDDLDTLGLLKVDCLALGMLTAIHRCFDLVKRHAQQEWTLARIPAGDERVYDMICRADTMGVFQIESRAQMSMLPRLRPRCFYDLVIEVAIVRPGPIQGNMVHPYLRRRAGEEAVSYPNEAIRKVLHKTLGVPIFQEQAMRLAVVAAGFTPGEADQLRRAMGAWRRPGVIDRFRTKLLEGMRSRGLSEEFADQVFRQIRGFGEYGFPESHAASFALLVYVSAWLKHYYPAAFAAALINSQPMGFYAPSQLIRDAQQHGVTVLPMDVNYSEWDCTLEPVAESADEPAMKSAECSRGRDARGAATPCRSPWALRLGLRLLNGVPRSTADTVVQVRQQGGLFESLADFTRRTRLARAQIMRLSEADVFQSLSRDRRGALWEALAHPRTPEYRPLLEDLVPDEEPALGLPPLSPEEEVLADYQTSGLSLKSHPLAFHRQQLDTLNVVPAEKLRWLQNGRRVRVAGLVLLRQRPSTAKGITFVTLEDETGTCNLLVHQRTWERFYTVARRASAWLAQGRIETKDSVVHVIVERLEDLSGILGRLQIASRDFR